MSVKHRDALIEMWRSRILRESPTTAALHLVAARALGDADVRADPTVTAMIESWVQERDAELTHEQGEREAELNAQMRPPDPAPLRVGAAAPPPVSADPALLTIQRLTDELRLHLKNFDEHQAVATLARIHKLREEASHGITPEQLTALARQVAELTEHKLRVESEIDEAQEAALAAAVIGDETLLEHGLRRLAAVHVKYPRILTDGKFEELRERIVAAGAEFEHRQAARRLVDRERALAVEIKKLAEAVHRFHDAARTLPHDADEFRRMDVAYNRVLRDLSGHDAEWFAGVILELTDLLAEAEDPAPEAARHVDRFVASVRSALSKIRREIAEIERESHSP
ncbi:MAG: hypothetical protein AABZ12_14435 [Planctomycetota bacterium]